MSVRCRTLASARAEATLRWRRIRPGLKWFYGTRDESAGSPATRIGESRKPGDRHLVMISLIVADFRAGVVTIRIAYSLDGQEVPSTPA
jgi:hypothetical protein